MVRSLLPFITSVAVSLAPNAALNTALNTTLSVVLAFSFSAEVAASSSDTVNKTLVWPDGTRYVGEVRDGKRWGKGTIFWNDGTRFVGTFANDLRNGPGTMILPDGSVYNGYFENDALIDTPVTTASNNEPTQSEPTVVLAQKETTTSTNVDASESVDVKDSMNVKESVVAKISDETEYIAVVDTKKKEIPKEVEVVEVIGERPTIPLDLNVNELTEDVRTNIESMIDLWAASWSDKNVVQYLAYYSEEFKVPGKQSRRQWEVLRRSRLQRPKSIEVTIDYEKIEITASNSAVVVFNQRYESDIFSDRTRKEFRLKKEGEFWLIVSERSL